MSFSNFNSDCYYFFNDSRLDSINKKSIQIIESSKFSNNLESNIYSRVKFQIEIMELNNQINSFLYTNNLDSSQVNVNVDSIEPDA